MQRRLNPEKGHRYMPYIVMIVDEFADLIMTAGKDISVPIGRIAQNRDYFLRVGDYGAVFFGQFGQILVGYALVQRKLNHLGVHEHCT